MSRLKKLTKKIDNIVDNMSIEQIEEDMKQDELEETKEVVNYLKDSVFNGTSDYKDAIAVILKALEEKDKKIESLNNQLDFIEEQNKYIDKLEKIIKEKDKTINSIFNRLKESKKDLDYEPWSFYAGGILFDIVQILEKAKGVN